jgi:endogenous inhibitor of DNA gyrase (YacG/DUF329 family)
MKSRCPLCNKVIDEATRQNSRDEKFYPFCSNRCKLLDLGKWLDGNYRIPAVEDDKAGEDETKQDTPDKTENG